MDDKTLQLIINRISQDASYKFGDLVMSYPAALRALVMAVVQSCITANLETMPKDERELFKAAKDRMAVITVPAELDPRKHGGQKREN